MRSSGGSGHDRGMFGELRSVIWRNKWWCLTPVFLLLVIAIFILVFAQGSAIAPFIYTLF
jgi:hypothetical protein